MRGKERGKKAKEKDRKRKENQINYIKQKKTKEKDG